MKLDKLDRLILAEGDGYRKPLKPEKRIPPGAKRYEVIMPWNQDGPMTLYLCPRLEEIRKAKRKCASD